MTFAYLQEAYLLDENGDHEVLKHDRAHHRNYSSNNLRPSSHRESSRIGRLLKKSIPSRQPTVESDPDIHTELPIKSPFLPRYRSTPAGDAVSLDIKPLSKSLSQPLSRLSRSVSRRSLIERLTPEKHLVADRLSIQQAVTDAGQCSQPATEELFCNHLDPSILTTSDHSARNDEPSQSTLCPPGLLENPVRKPRLSISKNLIQHYLPSPQASLLSWPLNQNGTSQMSLCSAESETYSETGPVTSPTSSSYGSNVILNNLRKLTMNSKSNLNRAHHSCSIPDLPAHEYPYADHLPITRTETAYNQEQSHTALDHRWFAKTRGERYHPHLRSDVPYWMSYGPEIMNHHILIQYASAILEGSSPFQLMPSSPGTKNPKNEIRKVLDVGCGPSATWCVGVLRETSGVEVVGLDMCPLLLHLNSLETLVSENLSFVQHDFSDCTLPFETGSFDYVHASFVSAGIPEHKWALMLEEMTRVLKRHGTLELLESNTLTADPNKAKDPNDHDDKTKHGSNFCRVPTASALINTPTSIPRELEIVKESALEACPTTVKGMVDRLLEQHFISPYPLSLLPTEISNVTTAMKRPLAMKFIRFPSDLQSFVDTQTKSPDRANAHRVNVSQNDPDAKAAADECIGMLLLHTHIDAMYSNKEISWHDLWLPSISCEPTSFNNLPSTPVKRSRPTPNRMPTNLGRHFQPNRRNKLMSPTRKMKVEHCDRSVFEEKPESFSTKSFSMLRESQINFQDKVKSMSHLNLNSHALAADFLPDHRDSFQHQHHEPQKLSFAPSSMDSSSKIFTHRKKFDQIWDKWKEDLNCHSLGISKLLELRFGWTCTMDIANHKALYEHYEFYQQELAQCEARINQLRIQLHEMKFVQISESEGNFDEDPNLNLDTGRQSYTHRPQSFQYETSSEDNEDFEHVNFAKDPWTNRSTQNTGPSSPTDARKLILFGPEDSMSSYGSNVVHHEPDSQSLEELGLDILKEASNTGPRTGYSSGNTGRLVGAGRKSRKDSVERAIQERADSESEESESQVSLNVSRAIPAPLQSAEAEQATETDLEIEIESLTRQKAEIKKAIQLIQTDLDNVTKRLGLSDPEDHHFQSPPATGTRNSRQTIPEEETDLEHLVVPVEKHEDVVESIESATSSVDNSPPSASIHDDKEIKVEEDDQKDCGMLLAELFSPFDNLAFSNFLIPDNLANPSANEMAPSLTKNVPKQDEVDQVDDEKQKGDDLTTRISIFNRTNHLPCRVSNLSHQPTKNSKDLRFTDVGFGDLRIEKFYSIKKN